MSLRKSIFRTPFCALWLSPLLLPAFVCAFAPVASGAESVKIGVLAFRPKPQTLRQWQPLAAGLEKSLPGRAFAIEALTYPEMNRAVAERRLDFVITNPGHFVVLKMGGKLSAPLATLAVDAGGRRVSAFGGVIVTRAADTALRTLSDLKGKTIAIPDTESLGGYQVQAYELFRVGVRLPGDATLVVTGMPHDNVLRAVLDGRADVGFVRSGVLEGAAREGKLDVTRLKVLNPRTFREFPQALSTPLYPEWPVSALSHIDENLARHVAAALLTLEENSEVARAVGIHGFSVPADYTPVELVLRELRFPPFDAMPDFTPQDVWQRYRWQASGALAALALIAALGARLVWTKRKLEAEKGLVLQQTRKLSESESRLRTIIETEPDCVKQLAADGTLLHMNRAGLDMIEADTLDQVVGQTVEHLVTPDFREAFHALVLRVFSGEAANLVFEIQALKGGRHWLETHAVPLRNGEGRIVELLGITRDITQQVLAEEAKKEALSRIAKLEGILPVCSYCKKIRNDAGAWEEVEAYVARRSDAQFSHGICPGCLSVRFPDVDD